MKIVERSNSRSGLERRRRFSAPVEENDGLQPGTLVCLWDSCGDLFTAKQNSRGNWVLSTQPNRGRFQSIPIESLFVILRRGAHIGFQSLGAEGRFIQASEDANAAHTFAQGFGSREAWEFTSNSDGKLVNAHYCFRELGAKVHQVTALRSLDLANWEEDLELRLADAFTKLQGHNAAAASSERRATDLIKASQRAAVENQKQLDDYKSRVETANRMALHWQEQASLANDALKEAQTTLDALRSNPLGSGAGADASIAASESEVVQELRAQIAALKMEHRGQIREMESRTAAALAQAGQGAHATAAQIEAIRNEAAAAIAAMEASHALEVESLLEEKARLDSALRCIKDMMMQTGFSVGGFSMEDNEQLDQYGSDDDARSIQAAPDFFNEAPAVGIPVEAPAVRNNSSAPINGDQQRGETPEENVNGSGTWSGSSFTLAPHRPDSADSLDPGNDGFHNANVPAPAAAVSSPGPPPATVSPAPADYTVFDAAGVRPRINRMYDMVNALRPNSGMSSLEAMSTQNAGPGASPLRNYQSQQQHEIYRFAAEEENLQNSLPYDGDNNSSASEVFGSPQAEITSQHSSPSLPSSRNRVAVAGGACCMVDYQGQRPDLVNEASMRRILDAPAYGSRMYRPSSSENGSAGGACLSKTRFGGEEDLVNLLRRSSTNETKFASSASPLDTVPSAGVISDPFPASDPHINDENSLWIKNPLSIGTAPLSPATAAAYNTLPSSPGDTGAVEYDLQPIAPTAAVEAMDRASPDAANFVAQYMADYVSVRASLPSKHALESAKKKERPNSGDAVGKGNKKDAKIAAVRRSAPGVLRRSTFLQRPLVTEADLFGGNA